MNIIFHKCPQSLLRAKVSVPIGQPGGLPCNPAVELSPETDLAKLLEARENWGVSACFSPSEVPHQKDYHAWGEGRHSFPMALQEISMVHRSQEGSEQFPRTNVRFSWSGAMNGIGRG